MLKIKLKKNPRNLKLSLQSDKNNLTISSPDVLCQNLTIFIRPFFMKRTALDCAKDYKLVGLFFFFLWDCIQCLHSVFLKSNNLWLFFLLSLLYVLASDFFINKEKYKSSLVKCLCFETQDCSLTSSPVAAHKKTAKRWSRQRQLVVFVDWLT